jgi:rod shape determining protein RodA
MRRSFSLKLDISLFILILTLTTIGLFAVFSATRTPGTTEMGLFNKQLSFAIIGILLVISVAYIPFRAIERLTLPLYIFSIILLISVYFIGAKGQGIARWIAIGPLKIQPAEIAKLATILMVAKYLSKREVNVNNFKHLSITFLIILLPFILIAKQPDLGTSLVFLALLIPVLFWANLNWFALFLIISPAFTMLLSFNIYAFIAWIFILSVILYLSRRKTIILLLILVSHILIGMATPQLWGQLKPYQQKRILTFADPESDPKGAGYQIIQSKVAIGSGGIWGKGYMDGSQTQLRFLPAQHTDFIFSVIGEEKGLFGIIFTLIIFLLLLLYMLSVGIVVKSTFAGMSIIGITTTFFFHIVINVGMTIGFAPVTGLPLPFISYGGSFLLSTLLMIAIVNNFSVNRFET